jgi:hypothetical protein
VALEPPPTQTDARLIWTKRSDANGRPRTLKCVAPLEMHLPTMCKPVTGDCPPLFSVRKARWLSSQTRMGTEGITRALYGVDYLRFQSSTYESVGHSDQPPNAIAAVVRGRSRLATAHSMPRTKGFACWSYGPKLSNPLTSPLWRLIPVDQQTHAQTSRSQDLAGIDWD